MLNLKRDHISRAFELTQLIENVSDYRKDKRNSGVNSQSFIERNESIFCIRKYSRSREHIAVVGYKYFSAYQIR
jgi:hypothetical protein